MSNNGTVVQALSRGIKSARNKGLRTKMLDWPINAGKGLDDVIAGLKTDQLRLLEGSEIDAVLEIELAKHPAKQPKPAERPDTKPSTPADPDDLLGPHGYYCTDLGTANFFASLHAKNVRYCLPQKRWYKWTSRRWEPDDSGEVERYIKCTVIGLLSFAGDIDDDKKRQRFINWVLESQSAKTLRAIQDLARTEAEIVITPNQFNKDPFILNCLNGTVDLRTGELREHRREDYCLQLAQAEYDPEARCNVWEETLGTIFDGNDELVAFMYRVIGMLCSGDVREHVLLLFWGRGSNGKSLLIEILLDLLGDYAEKGVDDLLMTIKGDNHPTTKATLFGKRLVAVVESAEGAKLNESLVKELTGGDTITARRLYENYWSFKPTHKLILCTNHKPMVKGTDDGIWRRTKLVEFGQKFWDPDRGETGPEHLRADKELLGKLKAERNGILSWAVRGCQEWLENGLRPPKCVTAATDKYRQTQDVIGQWVDDCCKTGPKDFRSKAGDLYRSYCDWMDAAGERPVSQRRFGESLGERGYERQNSGGKWWLGITLDK